MKQPIYESTSWWDKKVGWQNNLAPKKVFCKKFKDLSEIIKDLMFFFNVRFALDWSDKNLLKKIINSMNAAKFQKIIQNKWHLKLKLKTQERLSEWEISFRRLRFWIVPIGFKTVRICKRWMIIKRNTVQLLIEE